jgi:hypothetical protein
VARCKPPADCRRYEVIGSPVRLVPITPKGPKTGVHSRRVGNPEVIALPKSVKKKHRGHPFSLVVFWQSEIGGCEGTPNARPLARQGSAKSEE